MRTLISFVGIDSWNRPVFKDIVSPHKYFGSVNTLFDDDAKEDEVVNYFKDSVSELEYFGAYFGCEPHGGLKEGTKLEIVLNKKVL